MAKKEKKAETAVKEKTAQKSAKKAAVVDDKQEGAKQAASVKDAKQEAHVEEVRMPGIKTTLGNTLMFNGDSKPRNTDKGIVSPSVFYGTYNAAGKDKNDKTAKMILLPGRVMTPAQMGEYTKLAGDKEKQAEYLLKTLYPMHADDKLFTQQEGQLNGRAVNYVMIQKVTEENSLAPGKTELTDEQKKYIGAYQLKAGIKKGEHIKPIILTLQEREMYKQRAEVSLKYEPVLDKNGNQKKDANGKPLNKVIVESVGAPLTLLAIASKIEQRHESRKAKVEAIKELFPEGKYHYPESAQVTGVHWYRSKEDPKRVVMEGAVNNIQVQKVTLSEEASFALSNKLITAEQAWMNNKDLRSQTLSLNKANYAALAEQKAVTSIVERISDPTAKSFTKEQVDAINAAIGRSTDRGEVIKTLWSQAEPIALAKGADKGWFESAKQELNAVAAKTWEQKPEGVGVSR